MSYRIALAVVLLAILAMTLIATAWLTMHGGETLSAPSTGGAVKTWGWQ